jgi:hypothetical protein
VPELADGSCLQILATQEAEIGRIAVRSQPRQIVLEILSQKNPTTKNWTGGVAQGEGLEFKPQYWKKKKLPEQIRLSKPCLRRNLAGWTVGQVQ